MSDVQLERFHQRLERITVQPGGPSAPLQRRPIGRGFRPVRAMARLADRLARSLLGVAAVLMLAKAALVTGMGAGVYAERHAALGPRIGLEAGIARLLAPDPVAGQLADALRLAGLRDGWAALGAGSGAHGSPGSDAMSVVTDRLPQIGVERAQ